METTKNTYSYPIEKTAIKSIITKESPAHIIFHSDEMNTTFDITKAVDLMCELNQPVLAAQDGEVVLAVDGVTKNWNKFEPPPPSALKDSEKSGNFILIRHKNEEYSLYAHLKVNSVSVKIGQKVKTGDLLGLVGQTGWSIAPHLHFMVSIYPNPPSFDSKSLIIKWKK